MTTADQDAIRKALTPIKDPAYGQSMIELGLIDGLEIQGSKARMTVKLASPGEHYRKHIQEEIEKALKAAGNVEAEITWSLHIPTRQMTGEDPMPEVRNVVLIMSGKGGVGKSTCSANLSLALARGGARVGLLDADIYGPSMPTMFGVNQAVHSLDGKLLEPVDSHGIKLMSIGFMLEDPKTAVIWRGPMLHGALQQLMKDVNWGALDYLLMDLPPGTGDVALTLAQRVRVTGAVIVTTPQEVALQDVFKSVSLCKKLNIPVLGVIENMSYFMDTAGVKHELFGRGGGQKIAKFSEAPLLGQIPIDPSVREWGDDGTPVVKAAPASAIGQSFLDIAEALSVRIAQDHFERTGGNKAPPVEGPTRLKIMR